MRPEKVGRGARDDLEGPSGAVVHPLHGAACVDVAAQAVEAREQRAAVLEALQFTLASETTSPTLYRTYTANDTDFSDLSLTYGSPSVALDAYALTDIVGLFRDGRSSAKTRHE